MAAKNYRRKRLCRTTGHGTFGRLFI